jgi:hemoglobin-like flavoprotein
MFASYGAFGYLSKISSCVSVNLSKLLSTKPDE